MKLMIIRHGDPDYELDSLTEKGRREAGLLAKRLVNEQIDHYYLSPLGRALATAEYTLKAKNAEGESHVRLLGLGHPQGPRIPAGYSAGHRP